VKPYLLSILPSGSVQGPGTSSTPAVPSPALQARSSLSLTLTQTMIYPFSATKNAKNNANIQYSLRLLTPSPLSKAPFYVLSAPNDRTTLATEGTTLWMFCMQPWANQIDELVNGCKYVEALELLESLNDSDLPDKVRVFFFHP
jgi:hypothetical protein